MVQKVSWSESSVLDLKSNADFIALDNAFYAQKVSLEIYAKGNALKDFPRQGRKVEGLLTEREFREVNIYSWRIIYEIFEDEIVIARVIHMARSFEPANLT